MFNETISDPAEVLGPVQARHLSLHGRTALRLVSRLRPITEHQGGDQRHNNCFSISGKDFLVRPPYTSQHYVEINVCRKIR